MKTSAIAGGGLALGFSGFTIQATAETRSVLPPYLHIASDGGINLGVPSAEMGQGIHTTLAMLLSEELEVEMAQDLIRLLDQQLFGLIKKDIMLLV